MKFKKALYAGSFDPFTNGHLSIVEKGAELFDELVIGIADNSRKKRHTDIYKREMQFVNSSNTLKMSLLLLLMV